MQVILYVIARVVQLFLGFVELAMFARAILSWFIQDEESKIMEFLFIVTEPIILPIRVLCSRFRALDEMPLDIPFMITFLLLGILNGVLPVITL